MLAIRMQRTGRKGSAQFRVVVQDSRRTPTSGNIVALVGHYDPHAKVTTIDKEKIKFYLSNGAQPSDRVVRILQQEKVEIPSWVKLPTKKTASIKNIDKLRKNRPAEPVAEVAAEEIAEEVEELAVAEAVEEAIEAEVEAEEVEAIVEAIEEDEAVEAEVEAEEAEEKDAEAKADEKPAEDTPAK